VKAIATCGVALLLACSPARDRARPWVSFEASAVQLAPVVLYVTGLPKGTMVAVHRDRLDWTTYLTATPVPVNCSAALGISGGITILVYQTGKGVLP
jgi:hypothetical protein